MKSTVVFSIPWELHWPGGVNRVLEDLLEHSIRTAALRPVLFIPDYDAAKEIVTSAGGYETVRVRAVSVWNEARPLRHWITLVTRWPVSMLRLCRMLARINPAAVNVHFPGLWCLTVLWALRLVCPDARFVISFHGSDLREMEQGGRLARFWWRTLLRSVDAITCCSVNLRERLCAAAQSNLEGVVVIHNGIDSKNLLTNVGELPSGLTPGRYILNVATFEEKKGQDMLMRAFAAISPRHPGLKLVIVGRTGPALAQLRELAIELGIADSALLVPDVPHLQVLTFFRHARVFALSSREEAFGIVLLEAACFDVPIVATAVGGVPEIVEHGISGVLVPSDDPAAMALAIERVLEDPEFAASLAKQARYRIDREFTQTATFGRYRATLLPQQQPSVL